MFKKSYILTLLMLSSLNFSYSMQRTEKQEARYELFRQTSRFLIALRQFPLDNFFDIANLATKCGENLDSAQCIKLVADVKALTTHRLEECPAIIDENYTTIHPRHSRS